MTRRLGFERSEERRGGRKKLRSRRKTKSTRKKRPGTFERSHPQSGEVVLREQREREKRKQARLAKERGGEEGRERR